MNQEEAIQLLSARLDGELDPKKEKALEAWLNKNPEGRIFAEAFRSQDQEIRQAFEPRREAAAITVERVVAHLSPAPPMPVAEPVYAQVADIRRGSTRRTAWPRVIILSMLVAVLFWWLMPKKRSHGPEQVASVEKTIALANLPDLQTARPLPAAPPVVQAKIGETVVTKTGEKKRLALPDGSTVYLNQQTELTVTSLRQVDLKSGQIFLEAQPADAKEGLSPFVVETPQRQVTAVGTKFAVEADAKEVSVVVTQGNVNVDGVRSVSAGQELKADEKKLGDPTPARRASHELEWTRDLMIAAATPLVPAGQFNGGALVAVDPYGQEAKLSLVKMHVDVHIEDGFARTTIDQTYFNHENQQMEGTFYFPLPPDASLSRLAMYVTDGENANLMEGGMAERDYARQTYERIRHARRDPALLEWVDGSLFKMRVFPLEARQEKRLILSYSQKLPVDYGRTSYRFPAGHTLNLVKKWSFAARVKGGADLSHETPSHPNMKVERVDGDLLLTDQAELIKADRDVVLELTDNQNRSGDQVRWSSAEHEGSKYVMLRYRPELANLPKRERRDWVILFESSGARDPLVARAQVEVARSLLGQAEHDDTFVILTAGTRVRQFDFNPRKATADNVKQAIEFLERTHLIGALNLEQALEAATPYVRTATNPHLVHLGGGIASLGEQRADKLVAKVPEGCRYVGVAVGKRFSPAFMKVAAEKSGGYFTSINPDEPIAWRGFELASTLNTSRLLNITLHTPAIAGSEVRFLPFTNSLSQGEELAAVARVDGEMPKELTVRGTVNGVSFEKQLALADVAPKADYLPRTWAKLEIDRLLAEDAGAHREQIIELSKAMYVMTPFTSLLVLDNDEMYKEFKVDRGRKDHWAMYGCPPRIKTVFIPDVNLPLPQNAPEFVNRKPHENVVLNSIMTRTPPQYLATPGGNQNNEVVLTAGRTYRGASDIQESLNLGVVRGWSELGRDSDSDSDLLAKGLRGWSGMNGEPLRVGDVTILGDRKELLRKAVERDGERRRDAAEDMGVDHPTGKASPVHDPFPSPADLLMFEDAEFERGRSRNRYMALAATATSTSASLLRDGEDQRDAPTPTSGDRFVVVKNLRKIKDFDGYDGPALTGRSGATRQTLLRAGGDSMLSDHTHGPSYYGKTTAFTNTRVFNDLVSYAPGMSSSRADVQAIIEAEAAPRSGLRKGSIDPAARKRIEEARTATWRGLVLRDAMGSQYIFHFDGQGRYSYERKLPLGLIEHVVCDGTTLWHLYPELGIGAKRTVSRFHRASLSDLLPDMLPPADDFTWGADVKLLNADTVVISPLMTVTTDASKEAQSWIEVHLLFSGDRLVSRKWVLKPTNEELARESYDATGIKLADAKGKEIAREKQKRIAGIAPDLAPDTSALVVLPLPLRNRETVYRKYRLDPQRGLFDFRNSWFEFLKPEAALELLACEFGHNQYDRVRDIWKYCFAEQGDRRIGFHTLMISINESAWRGQSFRTLLKDQAEKDEVTPLARYLALAFDHQMLHWQERFGLLPGSAPATDFLSNLLVYRSIVSRWQGSPVTDAVFGHRPAERERTLAFVHQHADSVWGWCALDLMSNRATQPQFHQQIADAWGVLAERSPRPYQARYEQAAHLAEAGKKAEARDLFTKLFQETFAKGALPPIDTRFRSAFVDEKGSTAWRKLMVDAAQACLKTKHRPIIVQLAWQCRQLNDQPLADELLELALNNPKDDAERVAVTLAAIEYLWSIEQDEHADRLVSELLNDERLRKQPKIWRLASRIAERRDDRNRRFECLDKALDLEFARLPEVFSIEPIRRDYGAMLSHFEWQAEAAISLKAPVPADLAARTVRLADRWRRLDPEATESCNQAARILRLVGGSEAEALAWDFVTTPLALKPNESAPWLSLAVSATREGNLPLADRCYEAAFQAEPTNAQILWDRAKLLERRGEIARSQDLLREVAAGDWQPRFASLKTQARVAIEGK